MIIITLSIIACWVHPDEVNADDKQGQAHDIDGDGFPDRVDCDDLDGSINPGMDEICDQIDNDCDGEIDNNPVDATLFWLDDDGDGFGGQDQSQSSCEAPDGYVLSSDDCNDDDSSVHPGRTEICNDRIDNNCDINDADDCEISGTVTTSKADAFFEGNKSGDQVGSAISIAGDVNGDGFDDILIGIEYGTGGGASNGETYLYYGGTQKGVFDLSDADAVFNGVNYVDRAGSTISNAGDVNGDGFDDILIGAIGLDTGGDSSGGVYFVLGGKHLYGTVSLSDADAIFAGENPYDNASISSDAGDVNGDGFDDFIIGAQWEDSGGSYAGAAYLFLGRSSIDSEYISASNVKLYGSEGDNVGQSVSGAGDVDGDGLDDVLISAHADDLGGNNAGAAYLIIDKDISENSSLSSVGVRFFGEHEGDNAGYSVSEAGDVNGDGFADIIISALSESTGGENAGAVYYVEGGIFDKNVDLSYADAKIIGEGAQDYAGYSISGAGDVNGDGFGDFMIGAQWNDSSSIDAGTVYLIEGSQLRGLIYLSDVEPKFKGENKGDRCGFAVSGTGDINRDGFDDLLFGAISHNDSAGVAYLFSGKGQ